jgi:hypothetical protein
MRDRRVFVSDMMQNQIWKLEGDQLQLWLEDEALGNSNGVLAEGDRLLIATWGQAEGGLLDRRAGQLKEVDYETKEIQSLGGEPVANLDGLEADGQGGYLVTDWLSGVLYTLDADGKAEMIMDLNQGSANHEYVEGENLVVIPMSTR